MPIRCQRRCFLSEVSRFGSTFVIPHRSVRCEKQLSVHRRAAIKDWSCSSNICVLGHQNANLRTSGVVELLVLENFPRSAVADQIQAQQGCAAAFALVCSAEWISWW